MDVAGEVDRHRQDRQPALGPVEGHQDPAKPVVSGLDEEARNPAAPGDGIRRIADQEALNGGPPLPAQDDQVRAASFGEPTDLDAGEAKFHREIHRGRRLVQRRELAVHRLPEPFEQACDDSVVTLDLRNGQNGDPGPRTLSQPSCGRDRRAPFLGIVRRGENVSQ
jgi:hypothetical protein